MKVRRIRILSMVAILVTLTSTTLAQIPFTERVISTTGDQPLSVFAIDMDSDGDIDVLSASFADNKIAWHESDGGSPPSFTEHVISTAADNARSVFATDVDGDGDIDVLSASQNDDKIAWYESDGASPPSFTERVISTTADGAVSVFASDLDGDGDMDVLSASRNDNKIAWYESDGGSPPIFTERVISTNALIAQSVFAADVDGDGDIDVLSASSGDDKIVWYESDGASPPSFTERVISTTAVNARSVFATDVDSDGDIDVLSASQDDDKIAWYESDGGSPPSFTERVISTAADGAVSVFATDVDRDGDIDVLSASRNDDKIAWYESDGGSPPSFTERVISTAADQAFSVFAADLDGDGDTDVLSASQSDDKIAWYENTTPQLTIPDPPLPDPDSPGTLACTGDNYGEACMTCTEGGRAGELCLVPNDCKDPSTPHPCEATDALCPGGTCGGTIAGGNPITFAWPKNRYLGFQAPQVDSWIDKEIAVRVRMETIDGIPECNGGIHWVGPPTEYCEGDLCVVTFWGSQLQLTPHWMDWSTVGAVQIFGEEIVPSSMYTLQAIDRSNELDLSSEELFSTPALIIRTAKWGDVILPMSPFVIGQPDIDDVTAIIAKWKGSLEPVKSRAQLQPALPKPDQPVGEADVNIAIDAWLGHLYPFAITSCSDLSNPDPPLPDPDSPGGLACGAGPNYGQPCMTCTEGGREGELCIVPDDCRDPSTPHPCEATDAMCDGFTCGVMNIPWPKNRYIGFMPPDDPSWNDREIAIRVTLVVISHCDGGTDAGNSCFSDSDCEEPAGGPVVTCRNTGCNGEVRWAGEPAAFCEGTNCKAFMAAPLVANPVFVDWSVISICSDDNIAMLCTVDADCVGSATCLTPTGSFQIYGEELTPGSKFLIQVIDISNSGALDIADNYSNALHVSTARWGDVIAPLSQFNAANQPDINDVLALVGKWLSKLKPLKAISQLQPGVLTPANDVSVDDVLKGVNAWLSATYPFSVTGCP